MVTARRFTVIIEEKLLLKLLSFFGYGQTVAGGSLVHATANINVAQRNKRWNMKITIFDICRAGEGG